MQNDSIIPSVNPDDVLFESLLVEEGSAVPTRSGLRVGSRITLGRPAVYDLTKLLAANGSEPGYEIRSDLERYEFRLVRLAATLHVEPHSAVSWFEVHVELPKRGDGNDAIAYDLYPLLVEDKVDMEHTAKISPSFKFTDVSFSVGEAGLTTKYVRLEPKVTAYGKRENKVYWRYTPGSGRDVAGGVREMDLIVRQPRGVPVQATLLAKGAGRQWGIFSNPITVESQRFTV